MRVAEVNIHPVKSMRHGGVDATTSAELVPVQVHLSKLHATRADPAADSWLSKRLGVDVRLMWLDDPTRRPVNPEHGTANDRVSFADGYPLLVATTASLRQTERLDH